MSITQTLTTPPSPPVRGDKTTFSSAVANFLSWWVTHEAELAAWTNQANLTANQCDSDAASTASDVITSANNILSANALLNTAISAVNASKWVSGTSYAIGDVRWSPTNYQSYRRKTAGSGTTDPASDTTNWALLSQVADQTSNSRKILSTNGTATLWSAVKTIGGVNLLASGDISSNTTIITTTGTWTATSTSAEVTVIGGGGGSYSTSGTATAGGTTSFVGPTTITAPGGYPASSSGIQYFGGRPPIGTNGDINAQGLCAFIDGVSHDVMLPGIFGTIGNSNPVNNTTACGSNGSYAIKRYTNLVIGTAYTSTIGAAGLGSNTPTGDGNKGAIIIKT